MKNRKKIIIAISALLCACLIATGTWYQLRASASTTVPVYAVSELSTSYWGEETTMSGNITSDATQSVYLTGENSVSKVYVKVGDSVKKGDKLFKYDMTLPELDLQTEQLNKQSLEIQLKADQTELDNLKKQVPSDANSTSGSDSTSTASVSTSGSDSTSMASVSASGSDSTSMASASASGSDLMMTASASIEAPVYAAAGKSAVGFRMVTAQTPAADTTADSDITDTAITDTTITDTTITDTTVTDTTVTDPAAEDSTETLPSAAGLVETSPGEVDAAETVKAYRELDFDSVPYAGSGTKEDPYRFLVTEKDAVLYGSFLNRMAGYNNADGDEKLTSGYFFTIEVRVGDSLDGELVQSWTKDGSFLKKSLKNTKYYVRTSQKAEDGTETDSGIFSESGVNIITEDDISQSGQSSGGDGGYYDEFGNYIGGGNYPYDNSGNDYNYGDNGGTYDYGDDNNFDDNYNSDDTLSMYTKEELAKMIKEQQQGIKDLQLNIKESQLKIDKYQRTIDNATVKATINGVVQNIAEEEAGMGEPFIKIGNTGGLYVTGNISELMLGRFKVGQMITGTSYDNGTSFEAEIVEISPYPVQGDTSYFNTGTGNPNASYYPFTAQISDNTDALTDGAYVDLQMVADAVDNSAAGMDGTADSIYNETSMGETSMGESIPMGDPEYGTAAMSTTVYLNKAFIKKDKSTSYVYKSVDGILKRQIVETGQTVWDNYIEIKKGLTMDDLIAFPYGKTVKEGAKTEQQNASEDILNY